MVGNVSGSSACAAGPAAAGQTEEQGRQEERPSHRAAPMARAWDRAGGESCISPAPVTPQPQTTPCRVALGKQASQPSRPWSAPSTAWGSCLCSRGQKINCPEGVFSRKKEDWSGPEGFSSVQTFRRNRWGWQRPAHRRYAFAIEFLPYHPGEHSLASLDRRGSPGRSEGICPEENSGLPYARQSGPLRQKTPPRHRSCRPGGAGRENQHAFFHWSSSSVSGRSRRAGTPATTVLGGRRPW